VTKLEVQRKVDSVLASVGVPMDFICATEDDGFKKPRTGRVHALSLPSHAA
jgi:Polynucleotide kinase 3 phosphatase